MTVDRVIKERGVLIHNIARKAVEYAEVIKQHKLPGMEQDDLTFNSLDGTVVIVNMLYEQPGCALCLNVEWLERHWQSASSSSIQADLHRIVKAKDRWIELYSAYKSLEELQAIHDDIESVGVTSPVDADCSKVNSFDYVLGHHVNVLGRSVDGGIIIQHSSGKTLIVDGDKNIFCAYSNQQKLTVTLLTVNDVTKAAIEII